MVKLRQKYVMEGASNSFQVLCRLTLTLYQIHGAQFKTINYKLILKEERTLLRATKENTRIYHLLRKRLDLVAITTS